jgi:hypothetical protein
LKAPAALLLLIAAFVAGVIYVTRDQRPSQHGLTAEELSYVHDYGSWWSSEFAEVGNAAAATRGATDLRQLAGPYTALGNCEPSYRRVAGKAPKALQAVEDESLGACRWAERAAGLVGTNRYVPNAERQKTLTETTTRLISADRELVARLVLSRNLERAEEPVEESRIDIKYSQAATDVIAFNIEVRCWSRDDWAAIRRETAALGAETSRKFFGAAGAFEGVANLSPGSCAVLDRLAYEREPVTSAGRRPLLEALLSLGRESEGAADVGAPAEAQCDALQDVRPLASRLGATPVEARGLAKLGWQLYRTKRLDPALWTPACRDDGPFDKNAVDVWP